MYLARRMKPWLIWTLWTTPFIKLVFISDYFLRLFSFLAPLSFDTITLEYFGSYCLCRMWASAMSTSHDHMSLMFGYAALTCMIAAENIPDKCSCISFIKVNIHQINDPYMAPDYTHKKSRVRIAVLHCYPLGSWLLGFQATWVEVRHDNLKPLVAVRVSLFLHSR